MPALCQDSWGIISLNPHRAWDRSAVFIPVLKGKTLRLTGVEGDSPGLCDLKVCPLGPAEWYVG